MVDLPGVHNSRNYQLLFEPVFCWHSHRSWPHQCRQQWHDGAAGNQYFQAIHWMDWQLCQPPSTSTLHCWLPCYQMCTMLRLQCCTWDAMRHLAYLDGRRNMDHQNTAGYRRHSFQSDWLHPTDATFTVGGTQDNGTNKINPGWYLLTGRWWRRRLCADRSECSYILPM